MNNIDAAALRILLSNKSEAQRQRDLRTLRTMARQVRGDECPECRSESVDWNGCEGSNASYVCTDCGHLWDAMPV